MRTRQAPTLRRGAVLAWGAVAASALAASILVVGVRSLTGIDPGHAVPPKACPAGDFPCQEQRFTAIVHDRGVPAAFAELRASYADPDVRANCHPLTHSIGRAAVERHPELGAAFVHGDQFCASGYYHGVVEATVARAGAGRITEVLDALCGPVRAAGARSMDHHSCVHGLGHGLMNLENGELAAALRDCDVLDDAWDRDKCYGGAFMESLSGHAGTTHRQTYVREDQPFHPCDQIEARFAGQCYSYHTLYAIQVLGDYPAVFAECRRLTESLARTCAGSLGAWATSLNLSRGGTEREINISIALLCGLGPDEQAVSDCLDAAAVQLIYHFYDLRPALSFCAGLAPDLRATCVEKARAFAVERAVPL
jgi:hypothetical protein